MDKFVITIARGYGSGGKSIGKKLSEELGVKCYDRELLRMASDDSGINEALFAKVDEKVKGSLLYKVSRDVYNGEIIPPESDDFTSNKNLFNYQAKVLKELAQKESCIIIGRCADFVLKDMPNLVRVYVHAPMDSCLDVLERINGGSRKELEKLVIKTDKYRAEYYKYYTGRNWYEASNYDLCLNSKELSFDKCVEIIKSYMDIRFK